MFKIIGHAFLSVCGPWGLEPLQILRRRQLMAAWPAEPGIKGPGRTPEMSHMWLNHHETRLKNGHNVTVKLAHSEKKCVQVSQVSVTSSWDFAPSVQQMFGRNQFSWTFFLGFPNGDLLLSEREYLSGLLWRSGGFHQTYTAWTCMKKSTTGWWNPGSFPKKHCNQTNNVHWGSIDQATKRPSDKIINNPSSQSNQPIHQSNQIKSKQNKSNLTI